MSIIWSILGFVLIMGLIVTIHEWGHYQVARWFNIKITTFSIGFGYSLYEKKGKETCFKVCMIPLGGYVKFVDEREGDVAEVDLPRAFNRQSVYKRFAVVAAGPIINLLLAWFVFTLMYLIGVSGFKPIFNQVVPESAIERSAPLNIFVNDQAWLIIEINNQPVDNWRMVKQSILKALVNQDLDLGLTIQKVGTPEMVRLSSLSLSGLDINKPEQNWLKLLGFKAFNIQFPAVLDQIIKGGAAEKFGLQSKDIILRVNEVPIHTWKDFVKEVQASPGKRVALIYSREGVNYQSQVILGSKILKDGKIIGQFGSTVYVDDALLADYTVTVQYGIVAAVLQGYQRSLALFDMSLVMIKHIFFGDVSLKNLFGPISIAQFSGQALQLGLITFLSLLGLLSLSIGILNLLPIPILDGGHLVYYLIEMIKGSPVSEQVILAGQMIGLVLIGGLTFVALFNDIVRIYHG